MAHINYCTKVNGTGMTIGADLVWGINGTVLFTVRIKHGVAKSLRGYKVTYQGVPIIPTGVHHDRYYTCLYFMAPKCNWYSERSACVYLKKVLQDIIIR